MLTVVTPARSTRLVSAGVMASLLKVDESPEFLSIIDRASGMITGFCGRSFGREVLRQTFRNPIGSVLFLARTPAVVTGVTSNGVGLVADRWDLDGAAGLLRSVGTDGDFGEWSGRTLVVDYEAGYLLPEDDVLSGVRLPGSIEQACVLLVSSLYQDQGRNPLLRSEIVEGVGSTTWSDARPGAGGLPQQVADMLERYCYVAAG